MPLAPAMDNFASGEPRVSLAVRAKRHHPATRRRARQALAPSTCRRRRRRRHRSPPRPLRACNRRSGAERRLVMRGWLMAFIHVIGDRRHSRGGPPDGWRRRTPSDWRGATTTRPRGVRRRRLAASPRRRGRRGKAFRGGRPPAARLALRVLGAAPRPPPPRRLVGRLARRRQQNGEGLGWLQGHRVFLLRGAFQGAGCDYLFSATRRDFNLRAFSPWSFLVVSQR